MISIQTIYARWQEGEITDQEAMEQLAGHVANYDIYARASDYEWGSTYESFMSSLAAGIRELLGGVVDTSQKGLQRLTDELAEDILNTSPEEIRAEFEDDHGGAERHVKQMRDLIKQGVAKAKVEPPIKDA